MAGGLALRIEVDLLFEHDFIDEAPCGRVGRWHSEHPHARQLALQGFEQRHTIPNGKNVILHEAAQVS